VFVPYSWTSGICNNIARSHLWITS
jgi:hypothetical protein